MRLVYVEVVFNVLIYLNGFEVVSGFIIIYRGMNRLDNLLVVGSFGCKKVNLLSIVVCFL